MKLIVNYEEFFNLKAEEAFQIIIYWLRKQKAIIKEKIAPLMVEATHGSLLKISGFNPNYKKKIIISLKEIEGEKLKIIIESKAIGAFATNSNDLNILHTSWYNGFFQSLFSTLHKVEKNERSISEIEEVTSKWNSKMKSINPEDLRARYKRGIIALSIISVILLILSYAPFIPFHFIIIGTDIIIPGGISYGWFSIVLLIFYIVKYYSINVENGNEE